MLNTNIWTDISDGMNIVSNALRGISSMLNGPQPTMGNVPQMDMNMSRRDLPCYQTPNYNMNPYCGTPMVSNGMNMYGGYVPTTYSPYIPGISNPNYGVAPTYINNQYMNANPNTNMYCQLPQYQSPFMNNNTTVYGYPSGGTYGY